MHLRSDPKHCHVRSSKLMDPRKRSTRRARLGGQRVCSVQDIELIKVRQSRDLNVDLTSGHKLKYCGERLMSKQLRDGRNMWIWSQVYEVKKSRHERWEETARFGHPDLTNFGQFWPIHFWPKPILANPIFWPFFFGVMVGPQRVGGQTQKKWGPQSGAPKGGPRRVGPEGWGPERWGPKR